MNEFADGGLHPGLRVPALAWVPGSRREGRVRRPGRGRAPRADGARTARRARRLRGRLCDVPAGYACGHLGGGGRSARRDGAGSRRRLHGTGPSRDGRPPAPRTCRARTGTGSDAEPSSASSRGGFASLVLAVVHPTYAIFLWIPFAGFLAVRCGVAAGQDSAGRSRARRTRVPAGLFLVWLVPVVRSTASVSPDAQERARAFDQYAGQLRGSVDHFSLAPQVFGRSGAVAVAALLLIPLDGARLQASLGGLRRRGVASDLYDHARPVAVHAVRRHRLALPARRLAGFLPFGFALAGGMGVLASLLGPSRPRSRSRPGSSCSGSSPATSATGSTGRAAWATWIAVAGALVALVAGLRRTRSPWKPQPLSPRRWCFYRRSSPVSRAGRPRRCGGRAP